MKLLSEKRHHIKQNAYICGQKNTNMKKVLFLIATILLVACHENLEERAAREAAEYTRKNCPQLLNMNTRLDSTTFDISTRTFTNYLTLLADADNPEAVAANQATLHDALVEELRFDTSQKKFKDAGFSYRYVARSEKENGKVLLQTTITAEEYK